MALVRLDYHLHACMALNYYWLLRLAIELIIDVLPRAQRGLKCDHLAVFNLLWIINTAIL